MKKPKEQECLMNAIDKDSKGKCYLCVRKKHKIKQCWYYDANKTLVQITKYSRRKNQRKSKGEKKKKGRAKVG
jgi:hypothetical protein